MIPTSRTPRLELLTHLPPAGPHRTPLLFVHGAYSGAWCWEEHFLPYFAARGHPAYALSLRGHGASAGRESLALASISDYVEDVAHAVRRFQTPPVLVGHSMGGLVVQRYLERHDVPAAVLMASVPPTGLWLASAGAQTYDVREAGVTGRPYASRFPRRRRRPEQARCHSTGPSRRRGARRA